MNIEIFGLKKSNWLYGYQDSDSYTTVGTGMAPTPIVLKKKRGRRLHWHCANEKLPHLDRNCICWVFNNERSYIIEARYTKKTDIMWLVPKKNAKWMTAINPRNETYVIYWSYL